MPQVEYRCSRVGCGRTFMGSSNFVGDKPVCQQCRGLGKPPKGKGRRPGTPKAGPRAGFHGTTRAAAENIMSSGFVPSSDGMLGKGVYWSDDATKAKAYGTTVLKLTVMCGKIKKIDQQGHALQKTWSSHGFHTAWVPANCGMVPSELSENCTFDPGRIRVQAVSHDSGDNWEVVARCAACSTCKPESQYSLTQWSRGAAAKCMPCAESAAKEWRAKEEAKEKAAREKAARKKAAREKAARAKEEAEKKAAAQAKAAKEAAAKQAVRQKAEARECRLHAQGLRSIPCAVCGRPTTGEQHAGPMFCVQGKSASARDNAACKRKGLERRAQMSGLGREGFLLLEMLAGVDDS